MTTEAVQTSPARYADDLGLDDLDLLRLEQARKLKESAGASCVIVCGVIGFIALLFLVAGSWFNTALWTLGTLAMVGVTFLYAERLDAVTETNFRGYLRGHVVVSSCTGAVWSGIAIYQFDPASYLSLYIALVIASSITLGGMFPTSAYRATYIGLLTCIVPPIAIYWFLVVPAPVSYVAFGLGVFYAFGLYASARTELNVRDVLFAEKTRVLSEELADQKSLLEQLDAEKSRFMAAAVHDFSQPLHAQGYFIHALREQLADDGHLELLDRIEESWRSQSELLQGIAAISRTGRATAQPVQVDVDAQALLLGIAAEFAGDAERRQLAFTKDVAPAWVHTDPAMLTRILRNLLANAVKFTHEGGSIGLESSADRGVLEIRVHDTGVGIPVEDQPRVFDEYVRLPGEQGRTDGLGLGLSIVQRLADLLLIEVNLESRPGAGTTFTLRVPRLEDEAAIGRAPQAQDDSQARSDVRPLIVVVDDEQSIRDGMAALLSAWGCDAVTAAGGEDALEALIEAPTPSLLIVDYRLGAGARGTDLVPRLRDEFNEQIPAVLITGETADLPAIEADDDLSLMTKPVDPDKLRALLAELGVLP